MKQLDYEQYSKRCVTVDPEAFWLDGEALALIAYPLYTEVEPGETVLTDFGEHHTAPSEPGLYELWHYACGGQHSRWEWRKEE
jgi:hypothetical protein